MIHLHLQTSHGYSWHNDVSEQLFVRGYCFDGMGYFYEDADLLEYFAGLNSETGFLQRIKEANGSFSVIWTRGDQTYAAVDRLRSLPIVLTRGPHGIHLASEIHQLPGNFSLNRQQVALFPYSCHSLGQATLLKEVNQLQGGEWLQISGNQLKVSSYFSCTNTGEFHQASEEELRQRMREQAEHVWERLLQSSQRRTFVIPLSGGYDSRFIAAMVKHMGHEEVICFTYGRSSSSEVAISRQVAQQLGFAWHFVEYTPEILSHYLSPQGHAYQEFAANGISVAHEQDFFAIQQLLEEGKIPPDAIVLPGFGGDVLAGSWFPQGSPRSWSRERFIRYLIRNRKFFSGTRKPKLEKSRIYQMIDKEIPPGSIDDLSSAYSMLQYWGMRNRMSKFLVNAIRVYDFWGLRWRLPFFDHEWMDGWRGVPDSYKLNKALYLSESSRWLFKAMNIDLHLPVPRPSPIRDWAKQLLPASLVDELKARWIDRSPFDVNNQDALSRLICKEQGWNEQIMKKYDLNYLMGLAYVRKLQDRFDL